jgi:putative ABC transport system permease protein
MNDKQSAILSQPRFRAVLLGSFAVMALVLAVVGLYGVLTQMVAQRTRRIAICMALGATREHVLSTVFQEALSLACIGVLLGILGAAIAVRTLAALLYGVRPEDARIFALGSVVLLFTSLLASWNPARRASNIEPMEAIRME